jgi:hypothetical protein
MAIKERVPSLGEVVRNGRATDHLIAAVVIDDHLAIRFPLALLDYRWSVAISVTMILAHGRPSSAILYLIRNSSYVPQVEQAF